MTKSEFCFDTFDPGPYHQKANNPSAIDQFRATTLQRLFANVITSAGSHFSLAVGVEHKAPGIVYRAPITARQGHCGTHFNFMCICKKVDSEDSKNTITFWVGEHGYYQKSEFNLPSAMGMHPSSR